MFHLLRWLREAGIFICTISLLFLPWFYDDYPLNGLSPLVMGTEFLAVRSTAIIGGFSCLWLSYLFSRFTPLKWPTALLFLVGFLLYDWVYLSLLYLPARAGIPGVPLGRLSYWDQNFDLLIGGWLNIVGILLLLAGLVRAQKNFKSVSFILCTSGVLLGLFLLLVWGGVFDYQLLTIRLPEFVLLVSLPGFPVIGGLIGFFLARKYTTQNELFFAT